MPLSWRRRLAVLGALCAPGAAIALGVLLATGGGSVSTAQGAAPAAPVAAPVAALQHRAVVARPTPALPPLRPLSTVPKWLAPGGRLTVTGFAAPRARVTLLVGGRRIAAAAAGPRGRFVLAGRAPLRVGRFPVAVAQLGRHVTVHGAPLVVRPLSLVAVGDVTFGDGVGWRIAHTSVRYPWLDVAPTLRAADIATANLEGAVTDRGAAEPEKLFTFRGPAASARAAVRFAGIDLFTLANNHSRDYGAQGLLDTISAVHAAGARTVGAGRDLVAARSPAIIERGGLRIAFLAYNDVPPWNFTARAGYPGTAPAVPADIDRDVRAARRRADLVVVWFHWGYELQPEQNGRQEELARAAFAAGAKLVLGAHAHVLLPVEAPAPRSLIAWSLGNFLFVPRSPETSRTGILRVALDVRGVLEHRLLPVHIAAEQPRLGTP